MEMNRRSTLTFTRFLLFLCSFSLLIPPAYAVETDTLTVVSDQWCPYSCAPGSDMQGYTVEVMEAVFKPEGIKVVYSTVPYEQALKETEAGKYHAVLNGGAEDFQGWIVPREESGMAHFTFFVKKGSPWRYTGPESLAGKKVGIVQGYQYDQGGELDAWIADHPSSVLVCTADRPLESLQSSLLKEEVDAVIDDVKVFNYLAREKKLDDAFQEAGRVFELPLYIGFSPARPESPKYSEILAKGISQLRSSKKLEEILKKYGVSDWKK